MKAIKLAAAAAVYAVLSGTAYAAADQPFSALDGIEAQALSSPEMSGVQGQLTSQQIRATVMAKVNDSRLQGLLLAQIARAPSQALQVLALITRGRY